MTIEKEISKQRLRNLVSLSGQNKIGKKDMILSGFIKPEFSTKTAKGEEIYIKYLILDECDYEIEILVPKNLISDEQNNKYIHAEILAENNFHSKGHKLIFEVLVKFIKFREDKENTNSSLCYVEGNICYLNVYKNKIDFLVQVNRQHYTELSKASYIPCVYYNYEERPFRIGQYVKLWGNLIQRNFIKENRLEKVFEIKVDMLD